MKNKQKNELAVCGFAAVKTLEKHNPQKIKRFYFSPEKSFQVNSYLKVKML